MTPEITFHPLKQGIGQSGGRLECMIRITAPQLEILDRRPSLNLALVIDRSGSMSGASLEYAKAAAICAVEALDPTDRVAVITFDDHISTLVPSTLAQHKAAVIGAIHTVRAGGTTALHAGWLEGARQVGNHLNVKCLNRVILLSDGLANVGETDPSTIQRDCAGLFERGISTSTMGLGRTFNEDLLEGMAELGGGNYHFIDSARQLEATFSAELQGLTTTRGTHVTLMAGSDTGIRVVDILNDLSTTESGALILSNLVAGVPIEIGAVLQIPSLEPNQSLGWLKLGWRDPHTGLDDTHSVTIRIPILSDTDYANLPEDLEVKAYLATLTAARAKREAIKYLDRGDWAAMKRSVAYAKDTLSAAPLSERITKELVDLGTLSDTIESYDDLLTRKHLKSQAYQTTTSRTKYSDKDSLRKRRR
ncbi:MAG: VWA domain-containing protein [Trueperaceae bacterium]|nr:MAG: VWA domain-containing protein [Trueperaceae bacterium]